MTYNFGFIDTNDPNSTQCSFGLTHTPDETVNFRIISQVSGSANSSSYRDKPNKKFTIQLRFSTVDPRNFPTMQANLLGGWPVFFA